MSNRLSVKNREQCIGCFSCMFACSRTFANAITTEKAAMRVKIYAGTEGAFSIRVCQGCLDPDCARVCEPKALTLKEGGGVKFDPKLCTHCGRCLKACTIGSLQWDVESHIPIPCRHCGICAKYCPNDVIGLVEKGAVNV